MATTPEPCLETWALLNERVRGLEDEAELRRLLRAELSGARRKMFVLRIHSRLNRVRADRERVELLNPATKASAWR